MKAKSLVDVEIRKEIDTISELCLAFGIPVSRALEIFRICYLNMCIAYTSRHYRMLDWFKSVFTIFSYLHILKLLYLYVNVLKQKHDLQLFLSITG